MMLRLYQKNELWFSLFWIILYVLVMGNLQANFGTGSLYSVLGLLIISGILLFFILKNGFSVHYGLTRVSHPRRFLFFIPLLFIGTVNLWFGAELHYDAVHQLLAVLAMGLTGIVEEILFRGLLFRAIEKSSLVQAIVISSLTFGIGHIVNLFTGAATIDTLLQMLYAIAIGFAFVMVFYRSGSLIPCVIAHALINITAEFSCEAGQTAEYIQVVFLILVAGGYALYLRTVRNPCEE